MQTISTEIILGYSIATASCESCTEQIRNWLENKGQARFFACANPHSLVVAARDPVYRTALLSADILTPDGAGIVLASRILGGSIRDRITGTDVFVSVNKLLNDSKGSVFFLGSTENNLAAIRVRMSKEYPNITIAGTYSPPFKEFFSESDNNAIIKAINEAAPDVLWVGMTAPKQEKWVHENRVRLDAGFVGAIGAVFDFYTGNVKRSHPVFQRLGLEWLPRLIREPKRLWRRNFVSAPIFLWWLSKEKFKKTLDGNIKHENPF